MDSGETITIWLARLSAAVYLLAIVLIIKRASLARIAWTVGLIVYLAHVVGAFEYFYGWSHKIAYRQTGIQTAKLFGIDWGGGLYLNYLFTVVWLTDCMWWWGRPYEYSKRATAISAIIHLFLAFMMINATVVVWVLRAKRE